jgi:LPXTG-motif cell wall-anchored protein
VSTTSIPVRPGPGDRPYGEGRSPGYRSGPLPRTGAGVLGLIALGLALSGAGSALNRRATSRRREA